MTTLLVVQYPSGTQRRCNARCHNSARQRCECPCMGVYHGLQEGSNAFCYAVTMKQSGILETLGRLEQAGTLWIAAYRDDLTSPLITRPKGKVRAAQEPLKLR